MFRLCIIVLAAMALPGAALADETQDNILSAIAGFHAGDHDLFLGAATMHDRLTDGLEGRYFRFFIAGDRADTVNDAGLATRCERVHAEISVNRDGFTLRQIATENGSTRSFTTRFANKYGRFYTYGFDVEEEGAYYGFPNEEPQQRLIARSQASGLAFVVRASPDVLAIRREGGTPSVWVRCGAPGASEQLKQASRTLFGGVDPEFDWFGDHAARQQTIGGVYVRLATWSTPEEAPNREQIASDCRRSFVEVAATSFAVTMKDNYKGRSMTTRFALRPDGLYTMSADPDETLGYGNPAYKDIPPGDPYISESLRYIGATAYLAQPSTDVILVETHALPPSMLVRCPG